MDANETLSENWSGSTRFRILNKRPPKSWVGTPLTNTQVTSRLDTIWPEVWSSMSKCAPTTAKHQWEMDRTEIQGARQKK